MRTRPLLILACLVLTAACSKHQDGPTPPSPEVQAETVVCNKQMQQKFLDQEEAQTAWYRAHTQVLPSSTQRSHLELGTNGKAVMLIHGFISSPAYMQELALPLVKQGYTVLTPLLTGFGTDAAAANSASVEDWRLSIESGVALLKTCYPEVEVVAHSLGAALITDEIQNRGLGPISKLVLLAPYFKAYGSWPSILNTVLGSRVDVIDLDLFRRVTGGLDPYEYLPITRPLPGAPEPYLPIPAMGRVLALQAGFSKPAAQKVTVPTLVILSEADNVVDSGYAMQYVNGNFTLPMTVVFERAEGIAHSLELRASNPHFDDMVARIESILK